MRSWRECATASSAARVCAVCGYQDLAQWRVYEAVVRTLNSERASCTAARRCWCAVTSATYRASTCHIEETVDPYVRAGWQGTSLAFRIEFSIHSSVSCCIARRHSSARVCASVDSGPSASQNALLAKRAPGQKATAARPPSVNAVPTVSAQSARTVCSQAPRVESARDSRRHGGYEPIASRHGTRHPLP